MKTYHLCLTRDESRAIHTAVLRARKGNRSDTLVSEEVDRSVLEKCSVIVQEIIRHDGELDAEYARRV